MKFSTKALKHWKTTASGFLTLGLTTTVAVMSVPDIKSVMSTKVWIYLLVAQGIAKSWIGLIQQDAGTAEAVVPGQPGTQMVPSHEIPDDKTAVPVTKE